MDSDPLRSRSFEPLSQREREILALLAEDLTDREIAERLVLAYSTIKWHNRQIFNKLGITNRQDAVQRAFELGLFGHPKPVNSLKHFLPAPLTPFVGRLGELDALTRLLRHPSTRLVTLLAPGGMGKTRLALATAENVLDAFADGVFFVPLTPVSAPEQLVTLISAAVGLQFFPDNRSPEQHLFDFLRTKQLLLVLDNFEHLLESAVWVNNILQAASGVKLLVTSRERLNLAGETVYTLGGMPYPEQNRLENTRDYGAVQLFIECSRRANVHFAADNDSNIIRICHLVQGMPLALELAAAWSGMLSPAQIADEIEQSADFLRTSMRNVPERLRSVRTVFESTWRRMSADEHRCFRHLCVFRGGFTLHAAREIARADLEILTGLVGKALLWYKPESERYEVHELLRQYAAEQLEVAGEMETTKNAHRAFFAQITYKWCAALKTPQQRKALEVLEADIDNIREAFQCAIDTGDPQLIEPFTDLWFFYEFDGWYVEAKARYQNAIEQLKGHDSIALGKLLAGQAVIAAAFYQMDLRLSLAEMSASMLRRLGAEQEMATALAMLGDAVGVTGDFERQDAVWREGLMLAQRYGDLWAQGVFLYLLAAAARFHERFDDAKAMISQARTLFTKLDNFWGLGFVLRDLGFLAYVAGDYAEANRLFEEMLTAVRKIHHAVNISAALDGLRRVALATGEVGRAQHFAEEMMLIEANLGSKPRLFAVILYMAEVTIARGDYKEARTHLRAALEICEELGDFSYTINLSAILATLLSQTGATTQAVMLISFLARHPNTHWYTRYDAVAIQKLTTQLQAELPADLYQSAWDQGQLLTSDAMLNTLRTLI